MRRSFPCRVFFMPARATAPGYDVNLRLGHRLRDLLVFFHILRDDRPCVIVHRDDVARAEPLRRECRVLEPHRIIIANRQQRIVNGILAADQLHIAEERRIPREVDDTPAKVDDEATGNAAGNACAVLGKRQPYLAERQRGRTAEIHAMQFHRIDLLAEQSQHLRRPHNLCARARGNRARIADVVSMRM